jgi:two-component system, NarL family, nitrate/nitrite response regulator NarL
MSGPPNFTSLAPARGVLLVEDHLPTMTAVAGLIDQLRPAFGIVGSAGDLASARNAIQSTKPDIVVLDLDLDGEDGLDLLPTLHAAQAPSIVVLSVSDDAATRARALAAGARAFVSKLASAEDLLDAILAEPPRSDTSGPELRYLPSDGAGKG